MWIMSKSLALLQWGQIRPPRVHPKRLPGATAYPWIPDKLCCISEIVGAVPECMGRVPLLIHRPDPQSAS
jgi:hypothetical protein